MIHPVCIFDFDGTLVDSMPYWSEKMLNILRQNRIDYPPDIIKTIATLGDRGTAEYFRTHLGVPLTIEQMIGQMDAFALPKYRDVIPLKKGVREYLLMLKNCGCSLNVLTASPHKMLDPCLKRLGIYELFDYVWSTDDFGLPKVDPEIYREAARRLNTEVGKAAFFDDNIGAIRTAKQAGMYAVGVFDESGSEYTAQMQAAADLYVHSFEEMPQV